MENKQLELAHQQPQAITPMAMIQDALQSAIGKGEGLEVYDRLLERMERQREYDDRQAFNSALQRIQAKLKVIVKDETIPGKGKYASSKAVDKAIVEICNEEHFIFSFDTEDSGSAEMLKLVCDCSIDGSAYSRRYTLPLPIDGAGPKGGGVMTKIDATCAAVTKGKRYLKNMILNLRIEETDDEVAAGLPIEVYAPLMEAIENAATMAAITASYIHALKLAKTESEKKAFENAANTRKAALR